MILRSATPDDALDVLAWRNDSVTRAMSRNPAEIGREEHLAWFARALANPAMTLMIGEADGAKVGMVRFDRGDETEVSINVNPAFRGRGHGLALLQAALAQASGRVVAEVREDNEASRRLFERAGFGLESAADGVLRYVRS